MQDFEVHKQRQDARRDALEARVGRGDERQPPPASKQTEARLSSIFRSAPIGIGLVADRILLEVNDRLCEIVGYAQDELVGHSARMLYLTDEDYHYVGSEKYRQIAEHGTGAVETRWRRKDGVPIDILLNSTPVDLSDLSQGVTFTALDITARKKVEDELQSIFDLSLDMVCIADINTATFLKTNPAFERTLGYRQDELVGKSFLDAIHPDDRAATEAIVQSRLQRGESVINFENRYRCKDGTYRWLNWMSHPRPERGLTYAIARDITERKEAENTLRESEAILNETGMMARIGGWAHNLATGKATWTKALYDIIEIESGPPPGVSEHLSYYRPEDRQVLKRAYRRAVEKGEPFDLELQVNTAKGRPLWCRVIGRPVVSNGQCVEMRGTFQDITERRQAEQAQRDTERRFRALIEQAGDAIFLHDAGGHFVDVNPQACKSLGYTREELLGLSVTDVDREVEARGDLVNYWQTQVPERSILFEATHTRKNGSTFPVEVRLGLLDLPEGRVALALARDITERRQAEAEKARLTAILEATSDLVSMATPDGKISYINRAGREMLGWSDEARPHSPRIEDTHPGWAARLVKEEAIPAAIQHGIWAGETSVSGTDGQEIPVSQVIMSHTAEDGRLEFLSTIMRDLTERKQAEQALEMFRFSVEHAPEAVFWMTRNGGFHYVNEQACTSLGYSRAELMELRLWDIDPYFPKERMEEEWAQYQRNKLGTQHLESWHRRKDGSLFPIDVISRHIWVGDSELHVAFVRDVTERRVADLALRESETRFRELAEMLPQMVFEMDADGRFTFANHAGLESLGYTRKDLEHLEVLGLFTRESRARIAEGMRKRLSDEPVANREYQARRKDGSTFPVLLYASPIIRDGVPVGLRGIGLDISEQKKAEQERQARLYSLESMERINAVIRDATDADQMIRDVVEMVLSVFDCDRAWLLHPCDPEALSVRVPVEYTRPEYPGANAQDLEIPTSPGHLQNMRDVLASEAPLVYTLGTDRPVAEEVAAQFGVQSQMLVAVYPKVGQPWMFGIHQCSHPRIWSSEEQLLFREIGRRLGDGLSSLLSLRNLKESETRFREMAELLPQTAFETDAEGRFTFINRLAATSFGYAPEELPALHIIDLFAPRDRPSAAGSIEKCLHDEASWDHQHMALRKDGTTFPVLLYCAPIIREGATVGLRGIIVDITERQYAERALQESKAKLESILESSPNAICVTDLKGNIVDCNQATLDMYGYGAKDALLGRSMFRFIAEEDRDKARTNMQKTLTEGLTADVEFALLKRDGRQFACEVSTSVMKDASGQPMGLVAAMADITERKNAEAALAESEQRFRKFFENEPECCYMASVEGTILEANRAALETLDYTKKELIGKPLATIYAPESRETMEHLFDQRGGTGEIRDKEMVILTRSGQERTVLLSATHVVDDEGKPLHSISIQRDITERKQIQDALRGSEQKFRSLIANIPDVVWTCDERGITTFISRNVEVVCGYRPEEICGRSNDPWFASIHPDDVARVRDAERRLFEDGARLDVEYRMRTKSGDWIWLQDRSTGTYEKDGVRHADGVFIDITERKQAEEALQRNTRLLAESQKIARLGQYSLDIALDAWTSSGILDAIFGISKDFPRTSDGWLQIVCPQDRDEMRAYLGSVLSGELPAFDREYRIVRQSDQQIRWVHGLGRIECGEAGAPTRMFGTIQDITERKRSQEALHESERKLATLMANLPGMAYRCLTDAEWTMEFVSQGCSDLTGYSAEALIGNAQIAYNDIVHPDDRQYVHDEIDRALAANESFEMEYRIVSASGQQKWVWERGRAVDGASRGLTILEGFILDVSKRREAEQTLQAYQKKLKSLASELSLAEECERRRMAAGLHDHACQDLVLSNMKLQSLQSSLPSGPAQAVEAVCQTLNQTIEGIRDLTFDLSSPTLYRFGLSAALEELLKDKLRSEHDVHYQFADDGQPKPLSQDVLVLLYQSVRELLINAIKHARAHEVALDIRREKDFIHIILTDDGIGFDVNEVLSFPPQKRSVGLFNIIERLDYIGGTLDMESQLGQGSRFLLIAPLTTEATSAKESHDGSENSTR